MEQTCIFRFTDSKPMERNSFLQIESKYLFLYQRDRNLSPKRVSGPELRSQGQSVIEQNKKLDGLPIQGSSLSQILKYGCGLH